MKNNKSYNAQVWLAEEVIEETPEGNRFNSVLSNWIVGGTFFFVLAFVAFILLRLYLRKKTEEEEEEDGEHTSMSGDDILTFILCNLSLTVGLAAMLLIPITIVTHEVLLSYPENYWVRWLHRDLIFHLWNAIFLSSNSSLLVIIPFAHFFYEAEGFGKLHHAPISINGKMTYRRKSMFSRLNEAAVVLFLMAIVFGGVVYMLHLIIGEKDSNYLLFSYTILSTFGSFIFLVSTPIGFTTLTKNGFNLKTPFLLPDSINSKKETIQLEMDVVQFKMSRGTNTSEDVKKLKSLQVEYQKALKANIYAPIMWNGLSVLCTVINLLMPAYIVLRVFVYLAKGVIDPESEKLYNFVQFEAITQSTLESLRSFVEVAVIIYVMTAAVVGFYQLPLVKKLKPRMHGTSMHKITLNIAFFLLLSSSFPIVARILGLTSFDLIGYYSYANYVNYDKFHFIYKTAFMVTMSQQYFKLFPPTYYAYKHLKSQFVTAFEIVKNYTEQLNVKLWASLNWKTKFL